MLSRVGELQYVGEVMLSHSNGETWLIAVDPYWAEKIPFLCEPSHVLQCLRLNWVRVTKMLFSWKRERREKLFKSQRNSLETHLKGKPIALAIYTSHKVSPPFSLPFHNGPIKFTNLTKNIDPYIFTLGMLDLN